MLSLVAAAPVAADHGSEQTLLTATLTVDTGTGAFGCTNSRSNIADCSTALTTNSFTHEGTPNTVHVLLYDPVVLALQIEFGTGINERSWRRLTLHLDDRSFPVAEAGSRTTQASVFDSPGITWTDGQQVQVRLTAVPWWTGVVLESASFVPDSEGERYDLIVPEGGSDIFNVKLSKEPTANVTVDLSFLIGGPGTHWNPNAVTVSPEQLTFTPGNYGTLQKVTVTGVRDDDSNHEHIIVVAIVSSTDTDYASADRSEGVFVTVTDDGGAVQVGAWPATVREGATASVTVWLSRASTGTVTVAYATENGTATAGSDYTASSGLVTFAAGQTRKTVRVRTTDDTIEDSGETFRLVLSKPTGASLEPDHTWAPVTIRNDEALLDGLSAEVAASADGPWTALDIGSFSVQTTEYAATVPQGTTHARLVPTTADEDLTLTAGKSGSALTRVRSGEAGPAVALAAGDNVLVVKAVAGEDVETTYAVTVNRGGTSTGGGGGGGSDPGDDPDDDPGDSGGGGGGGSDPGGDDPDDPGDDDQGDGGPANRGPETAAEIVDPTLRSGAELEIELSDAFDDPDGDALTYEAESSDESVATAAVDGGTLTVRGIGRGTAEITVTAEDADGRTASQTFVATVTAPDTAWYLPPASDTLRQGFVRVLNHSDVAGEASIAATDDAGVAYEPLTLALGPRAAAHFHTGDLESGNPARGLSGATGPGTGGWRLAIESETLDVEALAYVRTDDGFLAGLNDVAPQEDGALAIPIFNPASNVEQASHLRLVNPGDEEAEATVTGTDDAGLSPGSPVVLTLPAGTACMVDAAQLESGTGLACGAPQDGLGDGAGKWRLAVESDKPLVAMSLLSSSGGHLANLSGKASPDWEDMWHVHLFPAASDPLGRQGVVRAVNPRSYRGTATVLAYDDSDTRYDALRLSLGAGQTAHFNSDDLELGNRAKGLTGSTGSGTGTWRLTMYGVGEAHAYVRTADGFLAAMNAVAPRARSVYRVAFFNPGTNRRTSVLRLVNRTRREAEALIDGTDDLGLRPGTTVRVVVPATDAVELTAAELESGEHGAITSGALGDGTGKWRLRVESARLTAVMSLLSSPSGHLTNLSRADAARGLGDLPTALLPPPDTVTLESVGDGHVEGRWSGAEDARYDVHLMHDGVHDELRSLERARSTSFRWTSNGAGTYTIRARTVNEDGLGGPWRVSDEVVID